MRTFIPKLKEIKRNWYLINAKDMVLGRLATKTATILRGKHKVDYTPNFDMGDFVVIINAAYIKLTGKKMEQKEYIHHTNYPGGIKSKILKDVFKSNPSEPLKRAIIGMIPDNHHKKTQIKRLKIYNDEKHKQTQDLIRLEL